MSETAEQAARAIEDRRRFRNALGRFATGVTVVTARGPDGADVGVTANSFNSVSLNPPMVLWSIARDSNSIRTFEESDHFAVHVLGSGQRAISDRFARKGGDKFAGLDIGRGRAGVPLIAGSAAVFQCRTAHRYDGGDHVIIVGEVLEFDEAAHAPLIYHAGQYGLVAEGGDDTPGAIVDRATDRPMAALLSDMLEAMGSQHRALAASLDLSPTESRVLSAMTTPGRRTADAWTWAGAGSLVPAGPDDTEATVASLLSRGLVAEPSPGDTVLTASGIEALDRLAEIGRTVEAAALAPLDGGEREQLRGLLERLRGAGRRA